MKDLFEIFKGWLATQLDKLKSKNPVIFTITQTILVGIGMLLMVPETKEFIQSWDFLKSIPDLYVYLVAFINFLIAAFRSARTTRLKAEYVNKRKIPTKRAA